MRPTQVLCVRNITRMIKLNWFTRGKIKVSHTPTEEILKSYGYNVTDIKEILFPLKEKPKLNIIGIYEKELPLDQNHPDYKVIPCYIYKDDDVLLEGLKQAKVLTNTVEISDGLPSSVTEHEQKLNFPDEIHSEIKRKIFLSCVFEATQEALPYVKDSTKPHYENRKKYGITDVRKNELLCKNLMMICEQLGNNPLHKAVVSDCTYCSSFEAHGKKIQFELTSELSVTTSNMLSAMAEPSSTYSVELPHLHPIDCTVSLKNYNFYNFHDLYPFSIKSKWPFIQTAIIHYNHTRIKNIFEDEITEDQIYSRSLLKGFNMAAAQARAIYGSDAKELPKPVVVPVVHTDGQLFHFTIFQLNTLEIDKQSKTKNIFWNSPRIPLYKTCEYRKGRPVLEEYNQDVIKKLVAFYNIE